MPRFDGTGPIGQGPMTGMGMGYCAVPVSQLASPPGRVTSTANPYYYPTLASPAIRVACGVPGIGYPRLGRRPRFGYGRGLGRRRGRGRW